MKTRMYFSILISGLIGWFGLSTPTVQAQYESDWVLDEHAYEYDMSMFVSVHKGETLISRWNELEIAAFCGTECRGIAVVEQISVAGLYYYYLRVRSNVQKGDILHFKSFDKVSGAVFEFTESVEFEHLKQLGQPSSPFKLVIPQENRAPVADAGPDRSVEQGVTVTLDGSGSLDPDGNSLNYAWSAPTEVTLSSSTVVNPTFTAPYVTTDTPLTFSLIVDDGALYSLMDEVVITIKQTVGINAHQDHAEVQIYPNPSKDFIYIQFDQMPLAGILLSVYDVLGNRIFMSTATQKEECLNLSGNPPGMYFITFGQPILKSYKVVRK